MEHTQIQDRFVELRSEGCTYKHIAKELSVSEGTLVKWSKERKEEIANLKAIDVEEVQNRSYGLRTKRLELFGGVLRSLESELSKRDLSTLSTEKILELVLRYGAHLKGEEKETVFTETTSHSMVDLSFNTSQTDTWSA